MAKLPRAVLEDERWELYLLCRASGIECPKVSAVVARRMVLELRDALAEGRPAVLSPVKHTRGRASSRGGRHRVPSQREMKRAFLEREAKRKAAAL